MDAKLATVKSHETNGAAATPASPRGRRSTAESIRLELAEAWGEMGAAWGVTPAIARVQAYLMARQEPLTEREVREALGLSHRAASLALAEAEAWGIVERVPEPRRVGRRGPAGVAYLAVGDHFQWFGRVIAERKVREGDPVVAVLEQKAKEAAAASAADPDDGELADLHDWLASFVVFVRLFDRAVGLIPQLEPREMERSLQLLGPGAGRHDPAAVRPARWPRRRRRPGARRGPFAAVADGRAARDEAHVGGRPHGLALSGHAKGPPGSSTREALVSSRGGVISRCRGRAS